MENKYRYPSTQNNQDCRLKTLTYYSKRLIGKNKIKLIENNVEIFNWEVNV